MPSATVKKRQNTEHPTRGSSLASPSPPRVRAITRPIVGRGMRLRLWSGAMLLVMSSTAAAPYSLQTRRLDLRSAIAIALDNAPIAKAVELDVRKAGLEAQRLWTQLRLPSMSLGFRTGLVPEARGDIFSSPDQAEDLDGFGPFYQVDIELVQPLFTFGKASTALQAARHAVSVAEAGRDETRQDLTVKVVRAYWAVLGEERAVALAGELRQRYEELAAMVLDELEKPDSTVDETDRLEVDTFRFEIERAWEESNNRHVLAKRAMILLLALDGDEEIETEPVTSPEFRLVSSDLATMFRTARQSNPVARKLEAGTDALGAKVSFFRAGFYPDLFFAGGFRYGVAGNRQDQKNPFVVDNFNYRALGAFLGIRWNLDFVTQKIEMQKALTEHDALRERLDALHRQITFDVQQGFFDAGSRYRLFDSARTSRNAARAWLRLSMDNFELGLGDVERVIKAYQAYARLQQAVIEQEVDYNVALVYLAMTLGDAKRYLEWVEGGEVVLE